MAPIPGIGEIPGAIDPKDGVWHGRATANPLDEILRMARQANQMGKDEGPLTLERSKTVDEEISGHVIDWLDRNDPKKTGKPFFCWVQPRAHAHHDDAVAEV